MHEIAEHHHVQMAQVALAWLWAKRVASPIVGATKESHLTSAAEALDLKLSNEEITALEEPYLPHKIIGAINHNPAAGVMVIDDHN